MSTKKPRKSLEDSLANEFVFGSQKQSEVNPDPEVEHSHDTSKSEEKPVESNLVSKLQTPSKEATVRFTVDMPESMHRKLSMLAAKTGRKKVDIVRLLLEDALKGVEE